jgi:DNA-binding FrmR family transcriptional regulator
MPETRNLAPRSPKPFSRTARAAAPLAKQHCRAAAPCACDGEARKAVAVDPQIKEANRKRLRRIEGQIRGLQKMVEEERYCADIITQVASVQEALRGVARSLMRNHLHHCAAKALRSGEPQETEAMYDELLNLIYTHLR